MNVRNGKSIDVLNVIVYGGLNALKIEKTCMRTKIATCQALPSSMAFSNFQVAMRSCTNGIKTRIGNVKYFNQLFFDLLLSILLDDYFCFVPRTICFKMDKDSAKGQ